VPDIASLPSAPDLAVVAAPPERMAGLVAELGARGTRAVVALGGGAPGARGRWQAVLDAARPHTLRVIGPNCVGLLVPPLGLNASCAPVSAASGHVAFAAQSGAVVTSVLDWARPRGIGFSCAVCLGDMADVDFADLLDYLANEPGTRAVLLYLETVANGRKLMSAGRAAARSKPVIVVKAGRHAGAAAAAGASLAAALAASDAVYDAALGRAGILRVARLEDLFGAFETLASAPLPRGDRLAILANGAGLGALAADALCDAGGRLAAPSAATCARLAALLPAEAPLEQPLDLGGDADPARYGDALDVLLEDPGADAVLAIYGPALAARAEDVARVLAARAGARSGGAVVLTSFVGGERAEAGRRVAAAEQLPAYPTPERAARAFVQLARYRRSQELLMETPPSIPDAFAPDAGRARALAREALASGRSALRPDETAALLLAYGFELAPPLAASASGDARTNDPSADEPVELFVATAAHSVFGPVVLFGPGGPDAVRRADAGIGLPPLNLHLAREVVLGTRVGVLLRDAEPRRADLDAVALALVRVAQLVADVPELVELDVHPLLARPDGVAVAGAAVRVAPAGGGAPDARLAIRPYPRELEEDVPLADGRRLRLRPIQPEDEPALRRSFAKLTPEEVRLRFFVPLKTLSHAMAARFTQLDYDREMALVLTDPGLPGTSDIYGVARLHADPDNERAEFALVVRHDVTRRGLGTLLMERLLAWARGRGVGELFGDVLRENTPMRALCRRLGFRETTSPDDPTVVRVTRRTRALPP
jgi:acetyltransferase